MRLKYITTEALDDLKLNFELNKKQYLSDSNQWFVDYLEKSGSLLESKIECKDFNFNYDEDYNVSDFENVKNVYENMKQLSPSLAMDERLWASLCHVQFWDYVKYRRKNEIESGDISKMKLGFVFTRGNKRSLFINCLSRLWWAGYLTYDASSKDPYHLTKMICESAFASNIMLISSSNLTGNKNNILGVLSSIEKRHLKGEKIKREHYVDSIKYLNNIGAVTILDMLSREEIEQKVDIFLNNRFGII